MIYNSKSFAPGIPEGQTHATPSNKGPQLAGVCNDKFSSGRVKRWFGKAVAMTLLLVFAIETQVAAQNITGASTTNYVLKFTNTSGVTPTAGNSQIYDDGATGITFGNGATAPTNYFDILVPGVASTAEQCLRMRINETGGPDDFFQIYNGTALDGTFAPTLWGNIDHSAGGTDARCPLGFIGSVSTGNDDNTTAPMMAFGARRYNSGTFTGVVNRPLFAWNNFTTTVMQMDVHGDLGIGTGTSAIGSALSIQGANFGGMTFNDIIDAKSWLGSTLLHLTGGGLLGLNNGSPACVLDISNTPGTTTVINAVNSSSGNVFNVQDNGKVGMGLASPSAYVDIKTSSTSGNALNLINSGSTNLLTVQNGGNVGIGKSSPTAFLDILTNSSTGTALSLTNSTPTNLLTVKNNGQVGINISTPDASAQMDVEEFGSSASVLEGMVVNAANSAGNSTGINSSSSISVNSTTSEGIVGNAKVTGTAASCTSFGVVGLSTITSSGSFNTAYGMECIGNGAIMGGSWMSISDRNMKEDIQPLDGALDNLMKLSSKTYNFRPEAFPGLSIAKESQIGLIAQDVEQVYPNLVQTVHSAPIYDKNGELISPSIVCKALNYTGLIPVVISAVQQQQDSIVKQQSTIQQQQVQIATQQAQNAQLKSSMNDLLGKYNTLSAENLQHQNAENDLQEKFNTLLSEIEELKTIQAQCCGSMGSTSGNNNNTGNSSNATSEQPSLAQNVPNPFTQNTVISYYLPASMPNAVITIRSMTGTALQTFNISSAGHGQITVSQGTLAPATYEYDMIVSGKVIDSKKMIIVGE